MGKNSCQTYPNNIILMNYKINKRKNQSHILNINHHTTNLGKTFNMWLITSTLKNNNLTNYLYFYDKNCV